MIIIGSKELESEKFHFVKNIDEVGKTPPNSTILIDFNMKIIKFARENSVSIAVRVLNTSEAILSENLGVQFIVSNFQLAGEIQEIADKYIYDAKILTPIRNFGELEQIAKRGIDGAIFL
ncbi:hypothetical protein ThvES_00007070 [Thiovulum sp. ES]|nr:hypothetical protein ThvES_00007070 [Thiovulum sp. ES]